MKYKVSNVCQLLDKSKFYGFSARGMTFTYNNDGSFTVNGTATGDVWFNLPIFQLVPGGGNHTYLFDVGAKTGSKKVFCNIFFYDDTTSSSIDLIAAGHTSATMIKTISVVVSGREVAHQARFNITTLTGGIAENIKFTPQLFDLTEMYGAGNEPTTVAQFRADFPDEYYEYSPECWKRIRELRYVQETRNLIDKNTVKVIDGYVWSGATAIVYSVTDKTLAVPCKPNTTYTVSKGLAVVPRAYDRLAIAETSNEIDKVAVYSSYSNVVTDGEPPSSQSLTITTTSTAKSLVITIGNFLDDTSAGTSFERVLANVQLEEGSTATAYQPYGYLGMRQGKYVADKRPVQLVKNGDFSDGLNNWSKQVSLATLTLHDDFVNISCTNTTSSRIYPGIISTNTKTIIKNHIYATYIKYRMNNFNTQKWYRNIYGYGFVTVWATVDIDKMGQIVEETRFFTYTGDTVKQAYQQIYFMIEANDYVDLDIFKVEVFDLTEMYGAGNEPTSIEQFKADYPDDYYEYNPYNYKSFN